jgi:outer membrane protein
MIGSRLVRRSLALTLLAAAPSTGVAQATRLSLKDAMTMARTQSTTASLAGIRAEEVEARVAQRRADLLPSLSLSAADGSRTYNTASFGLPFPGFDPNGSIIGPVRTVDVRARVGMNLFDPVARARYRASTIVADSADAGHAAAMDAASLAAAAAYLRALRAEASLTARNADSASAAQLLAIAHDLLEAGVGVGLDVTRAEAQLAGVRSQLAMARTERLQADLALRRAIGAPLNAPFMLTESLDVHLSAELSEADEVALALRTRPELRAADAGVRAARQSLDAANALRLPTVGVFADQGVTSSDYGHLLRTYAFGVQLSVPLFEGGRTEGRTREQRAMLHEAEVRLADATEQVSMEVRSAMIDIMSTNGQVELARERLRLAEAEASQAQERFRAGVAGNADVISALLALTASRTQLIDAEILFRYSQVSLARAEGRLSDFQ